MADRIEAAIADQENAILACANFLGNYEDEIAHLAWFDQHGDIVPLDERKEMLEELRRVLGWRRGAANELLAALADKPNPHYKPGGVE